MATMSNKWNQTVPVLAGLILILGGVYLAYNLFSSFDTQIKTATIAAVVAFGVALTSNFVQRKSEMEFKIRERKVEAYQKIFDFTLYFTRASNSPEGLAENKLVDHFCDINYALVMWGSSDAILKWHEFQTAAKASVPDADERTKLLWMFGVRNKLAELVKVIRSDLGHADRNISLDVLADLFMPIRDKDESLQRIFTEQPASPSVQSPETQHKAA